MLVTHDRYLIDALASQIWEIEMGASRLSVYEGTYSQMRREQEKEAARLALELATANGTVDSSRRSRRDPVQKEERRRLAYLQEVENKVATLESRLAELGAKLSNPPDDSDALRKLGEEYTQVQDEMDEMLIEWEELAK